MDSPWRIWAKAVAVLDHLYLFAQLHLVIFIGVTAIIIAATTEQEDGKATSTVIISVSAVAIVVGIIASLIQIKAASRLLDAAQLGRNHGEALEDSKYWSKVDWAFLPITIIGCFLASSMPSLVVTVIFRGMAFLIVYKFSEDLKYANNYR